MKLSQGKIEAHYRVIGMELPDVMKRRLEVLGMTTGTGLQVMNNKSGGTMIVKIRGTRFALGKYITDHVEVSE